MDKCAHKLRREFKQESLRRAGAENLHTTWADNLQEKLRRTFARNLCRQLAQKSYLDGTGWG